MPTRPRRFMPPHVPARAEQRRLYDESRARRLDWRRLYKTKRWLATRAHQLHDFPLCAMCERDGVLTTAIVCDHVERHGGDEVRFFAGPFQSLCKWHHDSEKQRQERAAGRPSP